MWIVRQGLELCSCKQVNISLPETHKSQEKEHSPANILIFGVPGFKMVEGCYLLFHTSLWYFIKAALGKKFKTSISSKAKSISKVSYPDFPNRRYMDQPSIYHCKVRCNKKWRAEQCTSLLGLLSNYFIPLAPDY